MSDYTRDTLVEERPYLVNPGLFPNTVMNCVSGYAAIRHGLRGVNSTIAAGQIACFGVLGSAARALRLGYLDATLAGAVEEFSEQRAWQSQLARANGAELPVGEGVAVFVVERAQDARSAGRHVDAEIESVVTGFCPGGEPGGGLAAALERTVARALDRASAQASDIALAACSPPPDSADPGLGRRVGESAGDAAWEWVDLAPLIGECGAATSALQIAALLVRHRTDEELDGRRSLAFSWTAEGAVAAAVLRGHRRREASP